MPTSVRDACGARDEDLDARRLSPAWRAALSRAADTTRALFAEGRAVCDGVEGRLRWELRLTWLGATRILDRLERGGFDVFTRRPSLGWPDAPGVAWRLARWKGRRG